MKKNEHKHSAFNYCWRHLYLNPNDSTKCQKFKKKDSKLIYQLLLWAMTDKQLSEGSWKIWLDFQNNSRNIDNPNFSMPLMKQWLIHKKGKMQWQKPHYSKMIPNPRPLIFMMIYNQHKYLVRLMKNSQRDFLKCFVTKR